ncbi:hypothetical protein [Terrarubrum flagellatum]|uniref:hypothetical protein n=1 Tax=Terrirubrum flagellatum TaxID=2895980 RepID=UPI003144FDF8
MAYSKVLLFEDQWALFRCEQICAASDNHCVRHERLPERTIEKADCATAIEWNHANKMTESAGNGGLHHQKDWQLTELPKRWQFVTAGVL